MTEQMLEQRLEEWARWAQGGMGMPGLYYSPTSPGFQETIKCDRTPVVSCDREMEVERAVATLSRRDRMAADVLRAEYRAQQRFGDARYETPGNDTGKTFKRLGIGRTTYYDKLNMTKNAVWVAIEIMVA